ncbi:acyl-coenzyme A thioesterase THEM4-like [Eublepharis macularius]|uniref:Acyl-coenzyme A thioesterase THEM4 n=1 Tax=Eublepharis macularius TaxID=481883 RepID=A0AA97J1I7_EUBMA|nr:acyl-coenzyme A thioesterase THEM4-like [Eublepharis macularius]
MLRSCGRLVKWLDYLLAPRCALRAATVSLHSTHMPFANTAVSTGEDSNSNCEECSCYENETQVFLVWPLPSRKPKDYALPNSSWSKDMMEQFDKFMSMSKDGTWKRIPSHSHIENSIPEHMMQKIEEEKKNRDTRYFCRSISTEGLGFEYVMFFNPSQKRMVCIFQPGPYLEGPPGFAHGGSIATMLDVTIALCAIFAADAILTANLSINYKSPVRLGSVVLVDSKLNRIEGRKAFFCGQVQSVDGQTLHAEGTALVLQLDPSKPIQQYICSK